MKQDKDIISHFDSIRNPFWEVKFPYFLNNVSRTSTHGDTLSATHEVRYIGQRSSKSLRDFDSLILLSVAVLGLIFFIFLRGKAGFLFHNFFRIKERASLFAESSLSALKTNFILLLLAITSWAVFSYMTFSLGSDIQNELLMMKIIGIFWVIIALFFLLKHLVFEILSYVFFDRSLSRRWSNSYINNWAVQGMVLSPILFLIVYTNTYDIQLVIGVLSLLILFHLVHFWKAFSIFVNDLSALLYLFLYLCAVEIFPLIFLFGGLSSIYHLLT